jgi:hypothetical protein
VNELDPTHSTQIEATRFNSTHLQSVRGLTLTDSQKKAVTFYLWFRTHPAEIQPKPQNSSRIIVAIDRIKIILTLLLSPLWFHSHTFFLVYCDCTGITSSMASNNGGRSQPLETSSRPPQPRNNNYPQQQQQQQHRRRRGNYRPRQQQQQHRPSAAQDAASAEESRLLAATLVERGCCANDENERERRTALDVLEKILCHWASSIQNTSSSGSTLSSRPAENKWQQPQRTPRVALITFGSYRLGVHNTDSDLDVLALCPPLIRRADFFTSLVALLKEDASVEDLHPIPTAFTPVIKFLLNGIHIDLLFGRVEDSTKLLQFQQKCPSPLLSSILADQQALENTIIINSKNNNNNNSNNSTSNNNMSGDNASSSKPTLSPRLEYSIDDSDFTGTDEAGVRSLNGVRVSQMLLEMVPNMEHYTITLRAVKEWATVHGVYSNVLGFLGGVNFAILVAWVCMRHPKERPTSLLRIFFTTFSTWQWPTAVCLTPVQGVPPPGGTFFGVCVVLFAFWSSSLTRFPFVWSSHKTRNTTVPPMPAWNPKVNRRDGLHVMPIITPAYPSSKSATFTQLLSTVQLACSIDKTNATYLSL